MGKQRGGSRSNSSFDKLMGRIESCDLKKLKLVDDVVSHLQSNYGRDYARLKVHPFTKQVQRALQIHRRRSTNLSSSAAAFDDSASNSSAATSSPVPRKRLKRFEDESDQNLLRREADYLRMKRRDPEVSEGSTSDDEDEDGGVSSSDDVIFESKVDLEFDLMKDMLRTNYEKNAENLNLKGGADEEERNVEVEVCDKEKKGLVESVIKKGNKAKNDDSKGKEVKGGDGGGEKSGPMFKDIGGIKGVLDELLMEVIFPLCHPQLPRWLGVKPMSGILLHGPPGCGKTKLAHAIANESGVPFYKISATEVVSGVSGASEENIRNLFEKAYRTAPSIIFIDEIDSIASKRENLQREMERRIVTQLMTCMDESNQIKGSADVETDSGASEWQHGHVLVIGATNRADAIDPAIRRPGRFDREINLGVPDENARFEILSVLAQDLRLEGTFDLGKIARSTPGFVGADLVALVNRAGNLAMKRIAQIRKSELLGEPKHEGSSEQWLRRPWMPEEIERLSITMADFEEAAKIVQPSTRREGFSTIPNVKWEDVGGLDLLRKEFDRYIISRIKYPKDYEAFGVDLETGFLLYGPPGCGKTLIAKAVANEAGANFIHIKGPELLNKYVGESELAVRTLFARARTCAPCILFFDEVDAITKERGTEGAWVGERLFTQLLIELDGADKRRGVFVIGATNRPEVMDPAVKRPGRFGKLLYVPLPGPDERGSILRAISRKKPIDEAVDLMAIGRMEACENMSGADLAAVLNEAAMAALEEKQMLGHDSLNEQTSTIKQTHFEIALQKVSPSVQISKKAPRKLVKVFEQQLEKSGTLELMDSSRVIR